MLLPSTEMQLPAVAPSGTTLNSALRFYLFAYGITQNALGGFYTQPWTIPVDFDRSREARLYGIVGTATAQALPAGNITMVAQRTSIAPGGVPSDLGINTIYTVPANWPAGAWTELEYLNAGAPYFPAGTLAPNSIVGLRHLRAGNLPGDTWTGTLALPLFLRVRYHRLCQFCDCA